MSSVQTNSAFTSIARTFLLWAAFALSDRTAVAADQPDFDPGAIQWYRNSVEAAAAYVQTYQSASAALSERRGTFGESCQASGRRAWGVVLDVDETVLDNSAWRAELMRRGEAYSETGFEQWVRTERATALPGARKFIKAVKRLCGFVVFVTNRPESVCESTRRNLRSQELLYDAVLCESGLTKDERFELIEDGKTGHSIPPLKIEMYLGDNIQDFPKWTQSSCGSPGQLRKFGTKYFVLPNPMYGSWAVPRNEVSSRPCALSGSEEGRQ